MFGPKEVVRVLLDAGADKEKANAKGMTPLHSAADEGHNQAFICFFIGAICGVVCVAASEAPNDVVIGGCSFVSF